MIKLCDEIFVALWAAVEAEPDDDSPKLVLADYLDENDDAPKLSLALRWCVKRNKWPEDSGPNRNDYLKRYWWLGPIAVTASTRNRLPPIIDKHLLNMGCDFWGDNDLLTLIERTGWAIAESESS